MGVSGLRHAPAALYLRERAPGIHYTGGWVGLSAGVDTEARGKILSFAGDRTLVVQSVVRHYADRPTPASNINKRTLKLKAIGE
jgi:hypothetical protein